MAVPASLSRMAYVRIPEGSFYAMHDRLRELPLFAPDLQQLTARVERRVQEPRQIAQWATRSDLTAILSILYSH
ncbi:hypothetical protein [Actinoplanes sp. NPDC026670]|uniref:hypothetical protein n=1 Tax=Actinoplanes sp. NPDC026670 TaxID=3154700 RepID=UPI0034067ADA